MKNIDNVLPIIGMKPGEAKTELINELADYTTDRSLLNLRKSDGTSLSSVDRAKVKYLI